MIVDAQVHIWNRVMPGANETYIARHGGRAKFDVTDIREALRSAGVDAAVLVPPGWGAEGNASAFEASTEDPAQFGVMARLDPQDSAAASALASWTSAPRSLGYRISFSEPALAGELRSGGFDFLFEAAAKSGCPLMVNVPGSLFAIKNLAHRHRSLRLIVDHLGLPMAGRGGAAVTPVIDELRGLRDFPNVAVKASGLPSYSSAPFPYEDMQQVFRVTIDAFGPARVFWGSDLTRLPCSYAEAVDMAVASIGDLGRTEQDEVLGVGLCRWLEWPDPILSRPEVQT